MKHCATTVSLPFAANLLVSLSDEEGAAEALRESVALLVPGARGIAMRYVVAVSAETHCTDSEDDACGLGAKRPLPFVMHVLLVPRGRNGPLRYAEGPQVGLRG